MKSYILLEDIVFFARHGVLEQENVTGNTFVVNIKIETDLSEAAKSDNIGDTVNYAVVYDVIKKEMDIPSQLLEHVAGRIIRSLRTRFSNLGTIELKLSKKAPPITGQIEQASVIIID